MHFFSMWCIQEAKVLQVALLYFLLPSLFLIAVTRLGRGYGVKAEGAIGNPLTFPSTVHEISSLDDLEMKIQKKNIFLMFYKPWSGHSKILMDDLIGLSTINRSSKMNVMIAKIDCSSHVNLNVCEDFGVKYFPKLVLIHKTRRSSDDLSSDSTSSISTTPNGFKFEGFEGRRVFKYMKKFLNDKLDVFNDPTFKDGIVKYNNSVALVKNGLVSLTTETFSAHTKSGISFVKFYKQNCPHCKRMAKDFEILAEYFAFDENITTCQVNCDEEQTLCEHFELQGVPTLSYFNDGAQILNYKGQRVTVEMLRFILKSEKDAISSPKLESQVNKKKPESNMTAPLTNLEFDIELTYNQYVLINFFAPWCSKCKMLNGTWDKLTGYFESSPNLKLSRIDCTDKNLVKLCLEQNIEDYPTIRLYKDKQKMLDYSDVREFENIKNFVIKHTEIDESMNKIEVKEDVPSTDSVDNGGTTAESFADDGGQCSLHSASSCQKGEL